MNSEIDDRSSRYYQLKKIVVSHVTHSLNKNIKPSIYDFAGLFIRRSIKIPSMGDVQQGFSRIAKRVAPFRIKRVVNIDLRASRCEDRLVIRALRVARLTAVICNADGLHCSLGDRFSPA